MTGESGLKPSDQTSTLSTSPETSERTGMIKLGSVVEKLVGMQRGATGSGGSRDLWAAALPAYSPPSQLHLPTAVAKAEADIQPIPLNDLKALLGRLLLHYWHPDRPAAHQALIVEDYLEDLSAYPSDIIVSGIKKARRECKWMPKISELVERMEPAMRERRRHYQMLVELKEQVEARS